MSKIPPATQLKKKKNVFVIWKNGRDRKDLATFVTASALNAYIQRPQCSPVPLALAAAIRLKTLIYTWKLHGSIHQRWWVIGAFPHNPWFGHTKEGHFLKFTALLKGGPSFSILACCHLFTLQLSDVKKLGDFLRCSGIGFLVLHWLQTGRRMGIDVSPAFGLVVLVAVAYCAMNFWMAVQVGKARRRYNVPYPTLYANESENKNAKLFNCYQRGHQNSLEYMPMFFLLIVLGGLQHPIASAILGAIYCLARYFYFIGYSSGDPAARLTYGKYNFPALMGLTVCAASFGLQLLLGGKKLASQV